MFFIGLHAGASTLGRLGALRQDHITGSAQGDVIYGKDGGDTIEGGAGGDFLYGGFGNDHIRGQDGDDVIVGGEGDDRLEGGRGRDIFVYRSDFFGRDTILDYAYGDVIDFRGSGVGELEVETTRVAENEVLVEVNGQNSIRVLTRGPLHGGPYQGLKLLFGEPPEDAAWADRPGSRPGLSIGDIQVLEGKKAFVPVELSKPHDEDVTFYAIIEPTRAVHGDDYKYPEWNHNYYAWRYSDRMIEKTQFKIPAGQTRLEIEIQSWDNGRVEGDEDIEIHIFHVTNAVPVRSVGTLTFVDNQAPLEFSITSDQRVTEGEATELTVVLSKAWHKHVWVYWSTESVSADADDFAAVEEPKKLMFSPGETQQTIRVITADDNVHEKNESFNIILSNPRIAELGAEHIAKVTIVDNDVMPTEDPTILIGSMSRDLLWGGWEADDIRGLAGDDGLHGFHGNDRLHGGLGNDLLDAHMGDDWLYGGRGNDKLFGGTGDDHLWGGPGRDKVHGGAGADYISGGAGDDRLYGAGGTDTFVFEGSAFGKDVIHDFKPGAELIMFIESDIGFEDLRIGSNEDGDALIEFEDWDCSILLAGIDPARLSEDDFVF